MAAFPLPPVELPLEAALDEPVPVDQAVENVVEAELLDDPAAHEPHEVVEDEVVELVVGSQDPQLVAVEDELDEPDFVGTTVTVV